MLGVNLTNDVKKMYDINCFRGNTAFANADVGTAVRVWQIFHKVIQFEIESLVIEKKVRFDSELCILYLKLLFNAYHSDSFFPNVLIDIKILISEIIM